MKTYKVHMNGTYDFYVEVKASDYSDAQDKAIELYAVAERDSIILDTENIDIEET